MGRAGVASALVRSIAALAAAGFPAVAAAEAEPGAQPAANLLRFDSAVYWGADAVGMVGGRDFNAGIGLIGALNGDIGRPGWIVSGSFGLGRTRTLWSATDSRYATLVAGRQWSTPSHYFSLSAGLAWRDKDNRPDAGGEGSALGAVIRYSFDTRAPDALYLQSYGSYSTIDDEVHFHLRVGRRTSALRFGGEFMLFDDARDRPTLRFGAFVGDIPMGPMGHGLNLTLAAGYRHELEPGKGDGFYATLGFSMPLRLGGR